MKKNHKFSTVQFRFSEAYIIQTFDYPKFDYPMLSIKPWKNRIRIYFLPLNLSFLKSILNSYIPLSQIGVVGCLFHCKRNKFISALLVTMLDYIPTSFLK
uniref:(northern house mosquito) hypothetical protein n=1 Tax=Culex pipiens TaxID=7175 RepID=A0A8D8B7S8_CULPI